MRDAPPDALLHLARLLEPWPTCSLTCPLSCAAAGTYNPDLGASNSSSCRACEPGKANPVPGRSDASACIDCLPGTVAPSVGQETCDKCAAGTYQPEVGTTACLPCEPGHYCAEGAAAALPCPSGRHQNATLRQLNISMTSADDCLECPPGAFCTTGAAEPDSCAPGSYAPDAGMASCQRCEAGTYQSKQSSTACETCPEHSWCARGSSAPTACKQGTVGKGTGLETEDECDACPAGSWCSAGQAIPCGENSFNNRTGQTSMGACFRCPEAAVSPEASTSMSNCSCREGYYDSEPDDDMVSCKPCTAGSSCPFAGTTTKTLIISVGWYRSSASSVDLRRCPDGSKEGTGCIGGLGDQGPCKSCAAPLPRLAFWHPRSQAPANREWQVAHWSVLQTVQRHRRIPLL